MNKTEDLFISISPQKYRENKSSILIGQTKLLRILTHLQNLKVLSRQKNDLKNQLHKQMSAALTQLNSLKEKMPTPKIPKTISRREKIIKESEDTKTFSKRDEIEEELMSIQAKLRALNA